MTAQELINRLSQIPEHLRVEELNIQISDNPKQLSIGVYNKQRERMFGIIEYPDGKYYIGEYTYAKIHDDSSNI